MKQPIPHVHQRIRILSRTIEVDQRNARRRVIVLICVRCRRDVTGFGSGHPQVYCCSFSAYSTSKLYWCCCCCCIDRSPRILRCSHLQASKQKTFKWHNYYVVVVVVVVLSLRPLKNRNLSRFELCDKAQFLTRTRDSARAKSHQSRRRIRKLFQAQRNKVVLPYRATTNLTNRFFISENAHNKKRIIVYDFISNRVQQQQWVEFDLRKKPLKRSNAFAYLKVCVSLRTEIHGSLEFWGNFWKLRAFKGIFTNFFS